MFGFGKSDTQKRVDTLNNEAEKIFNAWNDLMEAYRAIEEKADQAEEMLEDSDDLNDQNIHYLIVSFTLRHLLIQMSKTVMGFAEGLPRITECNQKIIDAMEKTGADLEHNPFTALREYLTRRFNNMKVKKAYKDV